MRGSQMITVTESATSEILKVLETQEDKDLGIRVYIDGVG
jgi:Fe-S cluster assembly iron-binding protein IscA